MISLKLKPCPFCGEKRIFLNEPSVHHRYGCINCPACLVVMPGEANDQNETITAWNTRAVNSHDELVKALEAIVSMNVQYSIDRYGDASKAEGMACVVVARAALTKARAKPAPNPQQKD